MELKLQKQKVFSWELDVILTSFEWWLTVQIVLFAFINEKQTFQRELNLTETLNWHKFLSLISNICRLKHFFSVKLLFGITIGKFIRNIETYFCHVVAHGDDRGKITTPRIWIDSIKPSKKKWPLRKNVGHTGETRCWHLVTSDRRTPEGERERSQMIGWDPKTEVGLPSPQRK